MPMSALEKKKKKKENLRLLKGKNIILRFVGFADWFVELKRYSNSP